MKIDKITYKEIGETLYTGVHQSGLRAFIMPKPGFDKTYAIFGTKFGSITNSFIVDGEQINIPDGVAHFLEHKLFEEPGGNIFSEFGARGAAANAYTSFDITAYLFSSTKDFDENLKTLLTFVQNPYFTDENVIKEQGIIGQEITMYQDEASWRVFFNMLGALYVEHPVKIDIAGSTQSIAQIDKELLYKCHSAFYHPSNMVVCIVGKVNPESAANIIEECIKVSPAPEISRVMPHEPLSIASDYVEQKMSVARPAFCIGYKEEPGSSIYRDALYEVLLEMIFGKSSPLYNELYDKHLIKPSFSAGFSSSESYAFIEMGSESDEPEKVMEIIYNHIRQLREKGLSQKDFEIIKKAMYGRFVREQNSVDSVAGSILCAALAGEDYLSFTEQLEKMSFSDVCKLFDGSLQESRCALSVVRPLDKGGE